MKELEEVLGAKKSENADRTYKSIYDELVRTDTENTSKEGGIKSGYTSGDDTIDRFVHRKTDTTINKHLISEFTGKNDYENAKKRPKAKAIIAVLVCLALVLSSLAIAFSVKSQGLKRGEEYYKTLTHDDGELQNINGDYVGYITLPTLNYGYPVVSANSKEKGFYENHLFSLESNKLGTPYTSSNITDGEAKLTIVYANAQGSGMFGVLNNYLNKQFIAENPTLKFDTINGGGEWAVFSAFSFKGDEPFFIERHSFLNNDLFFSYILNYYDNSKQKIDVDANADDNILVLVGANGNTKTVVALRLLRQGETAESLTKRAEVQKPEKTESTSSKKPNKTTSSLTSSIIETVTSNISTPKKVVSKVTNTLCKPDLLPIWTKRQRLRLTT